MAGKMEFSPQVAFAGDDDAPKRKAPTAGLEGSTTKRKAQYGCSSSKGEVTADEEATADKAAAGAGLSEVTVAADETMQQQEYGSVLDRFKAEFAQFLDELFGNGPNAIQPVRWVTHSPFMRYYGQDQDDEKEEDELGVVVDDSAGGIQ
jgi:hypothetical protein